MEYVNQLGSILIRRTFMSTFLSLSDEQAGQLLKAIITEHHGGQPVLDDSLKSTYTLMVSEMESRAKKYLENHDN